MEHDEIVRNSISSGLFLIVWLITKYTIHKFIDNFNFKEVEKRRRLTSSIRNLMFFALIFGLMLIWASALKTFALSIVVIASAIAVGCKEYIMCFLGGLLKAGSNHFTIGDRISIGDYRGDVIAHTLFTTTLFEIGPGKDFHNYTGKKIVIPNSSLLTSSVINETNGGRYSLHNFKIKVNRKCNWIKIKQDIEKVSKELCKDHLGKAQRYFDYYTLKKDMDSISVEPQVVIGLGSENAIEFVILVPCLPKEKSKIEQEVIKKVFADKWELLIPNN